MRPANFSTHAATRLQFVHQTLMLGKCDKVYHFGISIFDRSQGDEIPSFEHDGHTVSLHDNLKQVFAQCAVKPKHYRHYNSCKAARDNVVAKNAVSWSMQQDVTHCSECDTPSLYGIHLYVHLPFRSNCDPMFVRTILQKRFGTRI